MGIVLVNAMMSLDGFIAGPNDEMDWVFEYPVAPNAPDEAAEEVIRTTGAVLGGRRGYEVGRSAQRPETWSANAWVQAWSTRSGSASRPSCSATVCACSVLPAADQSTWRRSASRRSERLAICASVS